MFIVPFLAAYGGTIATAASVAGTLFGAIGQYQQYQAAAKANQYNALVAKQRAEIVAGTYNQKEEQQRRSARLEEGKRNAAIAQSGAGLGGSNADVERQSEILAELDALNIRYEGNLERTGALNESNMESYYAKVNKRSATNSLVKGVLGAAGQTLAYGMDKGWFKPKDKIVTIGGGY